MQVCVNLTRPEVDIENEIVFVESLDFSSSFYIPADATLASELHVQWHRTWRAGAFFVLSYVYLCDFAEQSFTFQVLLIISVM